MNFAQWWTEVQGRSLDYSAETESAREAFETAQSLSRKEIRALRYRVQDLEQQLRTNQTESVRGMFGLQA